MRRADSRANCTAGSSSAIRMPMIASTTRSSTREKPTRFVLVMPGLGRPPPQCRNSRYVKVELVLLAAFDLDGPFAADVELRRNQLRPGVLGFRPRRAVLLGWRADAGS